MGEEKGRAMGMPLAQFTDDAYQGLASGKDTVVVGGLGPNPAFHQLLEKKNEAFMTLTEMMRGMH